MIAINAFKIIHTFVNYWKPPQSVFLTSFSAISNRLHLFEECFTLLEQVITKAGQPTTCHSCSLQVWWFRLTLGTKTVQWYKTHILVACSSVDAYGTVMHTYSNIKCVQWYMPGPSTTLFCCFSASFCSVMVQHVTVAYWLCSAYVNKAFKRNTVLLLSNLWGKPQITWFLLTFCFTFCAKDSWFSRQ